MNPAAAAASFFLIYGQTSLPPTYTVFATVSQAGLDILNKVAKAGHDGSLDPSPGGGKPNLPLTITAIDIMTS